MCLSVSARLFYFCFCFLTLHASCPGFVAGGKDIDRTTLKLTVKDVASASSDCDSIHESRNAKRGEDQSEATHIKLQVLEVHLYRLNKKHGLGFVAAGKVIDSATLKTTFAGIYGFLGFILPLLLAFRPAELTAGAELCALTPAQVAITKGNYGTSNSSSCCSYDHVTIGSVLRLKADDAAAAGDPRIEHFVVLFMENRPFDHYFGCMDLPGADSAATMTRNRSLPVNPNAPSKGPFVNVTCGTATYICSGGNGYTTWDGKFGPGAKTSHYPYSDQSDKYSVKNGAKDSAVQMFAPSQLPVKRAVAKNFGVFNKIFSSVPAASTPNHLFAQSATSCGSADNILYSSCGGANATYPQTTIFESLYLSNKSFGFFINDTVPHACDKYPKACDKGSPGWNMLGDTNYPDM